MILFHHTSEPGSIYVSANENSAVQIAVANLFADIEKVCGVRPRVVHERQADTRIVVSTLTHACVPSAVKTAALLDKAGQPRWEAFLQQMHEGCLYLLGNDRRGAIYAVYDFCERIGVSPWYFMADVPVKTAESIELTEDFFRCDWPAVKYRGIFLNDEEELEDWARAVNGESTIGPKTYGRIFELILRLKGNYIWPAMHVNAFNIDEENGKLAQRMGIVTGTSHCDMLHRSNQNEWNHWKRQTGWLDTAYDYTIPGENREHLLTYWRGSLQQHKNHECCYTIGMRGIHDSGFVTRNLTGGEVLPDEDVMARKRALLEEIFAVQRRLINEVHPGEEIPQAFVPYKEVLPIYDSGLRVPEDVTLIWVNDNHGYVRRYPTKTEQQRKGGNGLYYHSSYWAPPGMSWLFVCSTPLAHMGNELKKCFEQNIRQIWVDNVGGLKPVEVDMAYFLRCGWEGDRANSVMLDSARFLQEFTDAAFSGGHGERLARIHGQFRQLSNLCKPEHMRSDVFSQTAYGDEAAARLHQMHALTSEAEAIYNTLHDAEKPAFFQLFLMQMKASFFIAASYYYADRSRAAYDLGAMRAADENTRKSREMDDLKRLLLHYYNEVMLGGKWRTICTPEDFPPPPLELYPACKPALKEGQGGLIIRLPEDGLNSGLHFAPKDGAKWIDLFNGGSADLPYTIRADAGIEVSATAGVLEAQARILVRTSADFTRGTITIHADGKEHIIPVTRSMLAPTLHLLATDAASDGFRRVKGIGRGIGDAMEAPSNVSPEKPASLRFTFDLAEACAPEAELVRFLTLRSNGAIRLRIRTDDTEPMLLTSPTVDEYAGSWVDAAMHNGEKLHLTLPGLSAGRHTLTVEALDPYITLCAVNLYTVPRQDCLLGPGVLDSGVALPAYDPAEEGAMFGLSAQEIPLPYDVYCGDEFWQGDMVYGRNIRQRPAHRGQPRDWHDEQGRKDVIAHLDGGMVQEHDGHLCWEAENALTQTENASLTGAWTHRQAETNGRTGLAMVVEERCTEVPSLTYRIRCEQDAVYYLWALAKYDDASRFHLRYLVDGQPAQERALVCREKFHSYRSIYMWCWQKLLSIPLAKGEHVLTIEAHAVKLALDRFYMTTGDENPPSDAQWPV